MKYYFILLAIIILTAFGNLQAQSPSPWNRFDVPNSNYAFKAIHFVDSLTGWAVGANGSIKKTTNGGATWIKQSSGTSHALSDVAFVSPTTGCAIGEDGSLVRTTDGGNTWTARKISQYWIGTICFADDKNGWITGEYGVIQHTTDAGATWNVQKSSISFGDYYDISFASPTKGWAVGQTVPLKTTNGGATWVEIEQGPSDVKYVQFIDENYGWISPYNGMIQRTTDGGNTWETYSICEGLCSCIHFADRNNGWAVCNFDGFIGAIAHTSNGGQTWTTEFSEKQYSMESVFAVSPSQCRVGGWYRSEANQDSDKFFVFSATPFNSASEPIESANTSIRIDAKPNETAGAFYVSIRNRRTSAQSVELSAYGMNGEKLAHLYGSTIGALEEVEISADLSFLPPGKYFLVARTGSSTTKEPILITR